MSQCSRENCHTQEKTKERTVNCRRCNGQIHLLCYGIEKTHDEIFVHSNIFMLCDECITTGIEQPSPKRRNVNLVQRTINFQDQGMVLGSPSIESPMNKSSAKSTTQGLIESLARKLEVNTYTISALKSSVDTLNMTVNQRNQDAAESVRVNSENVSSIKTALMETQNLIKSGVKPAYANVVKNVNRNETPKSSKQSRPVGDNKNKTPLVSGTSGNSIGKRLSPPKPRLRTSRKVPEKSIWLGRLHRDTTEEEILEYIKDTLQIINVDEIQVRKLVKKDRDILEYTFISFKIGCSVEMYERLLDASKWPSYCQIREFSTDEVQPQGARLTGNGPSKNEVKQPIENQVQQTLEVNMEQ